MTLKRIVLSFLTLIVALQMGTSLISSLSEPQVGNQLQLYQTDLLVKASEWDGSGLPDNEVQQFRKAVFGADALASATEQYLEVRKETATGLMRVEQQLEIADATGDSVQRQPLMVTAKTQQDLIGQLDLRLGMVQVKQGNVEKALATWQRLTEKGIDGKAANEPVDIIGQVASGQADSVIAAGVLSDLWETPPVIRAEAEALIQGNLRGWYRDKALERLYTLQDKSEPLSELRTRGRSEAEQTLIQLSIVGLLPSLGGLIGAGGLIALIGQRLLRGKEAILALPEGQWQVPWTWETIWQVIVGGFLFVGQVVLPLLLQFGLLAKQSFSVVPEIAFANSSLILGLSSRGRALYSLTFYLLMSATTLGILYWSVKEHLPLPKGWFRAKLAGKWPLWGFGSYLVALPLMLGVSLLNQQIWQGQGGNNPILQLVLEERDPIALAMFFFTAAVAAPVFEEILFRGFLLPSLTRYMPIWGAVGLSSLIFSVAHLSFSEVLPLTMLGAILGFAYVRSQNLLSSILLHSTWNSITMIGLFLLGSGA
ncbi:MAG: type II CAAX endopeptidase family protein [Cyanobacteria bacterium P01_D01_bin.105]